MTKKTIWARHRELNDNAKKNPKLWSTTKTMGGARSWMLVRHLDTPWPEFHEGAKGAPIKYTEAGALKKAEELNAKTNTNS